MSTDYYVRYNICSECNRYDELELGRYSSGWIFKFTSPNLNSLKEFPKIFSYIPISQIESWEELKEFLLENNLDESIYDEYHNHLSLIEFESILFKSLKNELCLHSYVKENNPEFIVDGSIVKDKQGFTFTIGMVTQ